MVSRTFPPPTRTEADTLPMKTAQKETLESLAHSEPQNRDDDLQKLDNLFSKESAEPVDDMKEDIFNQGFAQSSIDSEEMEKLEAQLKQKEQKKQEEVQVQAVKELYAQQLGFYQIVVRQVFETAVQQFLNGNLTKDNWNYQLRCIHAVEKSFHNQFSYQLYGEVDQSFISAVQSNISQLARQKITFDNYNYHYQNISDIQKTLTPVAAFQNIQWDFNDAYFQKIEALCVEAQKKKQSQLLLGNITRDNYAYYDSCINMVLKTLQEFKKDSVFLCDANIEASSFELKDFQTNANFKHNMKAIGVKKVKLTPEEQAGLTVGREVNISGPAPQKEDKMSFLEHIKQFFSLVVSQCMRVLQNKKEASPSTSAVEAAPEPVAKDKALASYHALVQEIETSLKNNQNLSYPQELQALVGGIVQVLSQESIYETLSSEQRFNLEKIYPEVLQNIKKQCVLDAENFKLTGKKDATLPTVIATFGEKIQEVFNQKVEQDQKKTEVLHQYLKAKM